MHRDAFSQCHPLTNFLFFVGAIGFSVVIQHPAYLIVSVLGAICYHLLLHGRGGIRLILGLIPVFLTIAFLNPLLNTQGSTVLFTVFGNPYSLEALIYGMVIAGMLVVMMLWFSCYSAVLTSDKFICLFGSVVPALSMLLTMVLRLIPYLMGKAAQISGARKSIGKGVGTQSTHREKITDGMLILSALTDWALEGSIVTADSMRSRGYGTARRTSFHLYHMTLRDWMLIAVMLLLAAATLLLGGTEASFTPDFSVSRPTLGLAAYSLFLLIPCVLQAKEALQWHISISKI